MNPMYVTAREEYQQSPARFSFGNIFFAVKKTRDFSQNLAVIDGETPSFRLRIIIWTRSMQT